jgi:hypothetical protein
VNLCVQAAIKAGEAETPVVMRRGGGSAQCNCWQVGIPMAVIIVDPQQEIAGRSVSRRHGPRLDRFREERATAPEPNLDRLVSLLLEAAMEIAFPLYKQQRDRSPPISVVGGQQAKDCLGSVA